MEILTPTPVLAIKRHVSHLELVAAIPRWKHRLISWFIKEDFFILMQTTKDLLCALRDKLNDVDQQLQICDMIKYEQFREDTNDPT